MILTNIGKTRQVLQFCTFCEVLVLILLSVHCLQFPDDLKYCKKKEEEINSKIPEVKTSLTKFNEPLLLLLMKKVPIYNTVCICGIIQLFLLS